MDQEENNKTNEENAEEKESNPFEQEVEAGSNEEMDITAEPEEKKERISNREALQKFLDENKARNKKLKDQKK